MPLARPPRAFRLALAARYDRRYQARVSIKDPAPMSTAATAPLAIAAVVPGGKRKAESAGRSGKRHRGW
ncbi:MAG: hypothetical protein AAFW01_15250, partial [Pseudomonadota bacterium]